MTRFQFESGDKPLDGYTIEYALGRGGFGEVYYAESDAGRQVALKAVQNYEEIELRGIGHCMNLKSQHLVSIFDVRHGADGTPWVIMEFVAGPSLRDILDDSPGGIGKEKATFFVRELAKGLSYLHGAGVVHRDLKPHNVFFEDGIVKIGDYSLSKAITNSHRSGHTMTVGTVHYMAPEIGMGRYDKTVDIYALGVMLYEMMTGQPPYTGDSMGEVLMKHLSARPDLSGIEEPFASVIEKAMRRDPDERYQTAEEMAGALLANERLAESMSGFGPASLSIVADRAVHRDRSSSEKSTGRVDAAMTSTQREMPADNRPHPMRQLGRDLGGIAYRAAIIGRVSDSFVDSGADNVWRSWRVFLALVTIFAIGLFGSLLGQSMGASTNNYIFEGTLGPFHEDSWNLPTNFVESVCRPAVLAVMIVLGAAAVRGLISRGILPGGAKRCRLGHFFFTYAGLMTLLALGLSPVPSFFVSNLVAITVPMVVQNWALLTSPLRERRLRFGPVFFAAVLSFLSAEILGANSIFVVTVVAASSLAVQVGARFHGGRGKAKPIASPEFAETIGAAPVAEASVHSLAVVN